MDQIYTQFLETFSLTKLDVPMIFVGLALFFFLYKLLESSVFRPLLEHLEQREHATTGAVETAALLRQKAGALQERYDQSIFQARVEANTKRVEIVTRSKFEATEIVSKAEAEVARVLKEGRESIDRQMAQCRQKAEEDSHALAELLSHKVDSELSVH